MDSRCYLVDVAVFVALLVVGMAFVAVLFDGVGFFGMLFVGVGVVLPRPGAVVDGVLVVEGETVVVTVAVVGGAVLLAVVTCPVGCSMPIEVWSLAAPSAFW